MKIYLWEVSKEDVLEGVDFTLDTILIQTSHFLKPQASHLSEVTFQITFGWLLLTRVFFAFLVFLTRIFVFRNQVFYLVVVL